MINFSLKNYEIINGYITHSNTIVALSLTHNDKYLIPTEEDSILSFNF